MFREFATAIALATLLGSTAMAADAPTVRSIDVEVDLSAVQNVTAAAYWGGLSEDLKNAIAAKVANQIADDGVQIKVDIEEVELSNGFTETAGLADTKLVGKVKYDHPDALRFQYIDLTIDVNQVTPFLPEGYVLAAPTMNSKEYYMAMVNAFADAVVTSLK
jgi:hypothetical protein